MKVLELSTFILYFLALLSITIITYRKEKTDTAFVLGNRSLNYWLTALSAQASDMSGWLFMAYPSAIFLGGIFNIWIAIGLTIMMYLNWQIIAPKVRVATEKSASLTLNAYFENRFADNSGGLRIVSSLLTFFFYAFYISAGLVGLGFLLDSLFGINYFIGTALGLAIVVFYVFLGGYRTVAWIDLLQGLFLMGVILSIPIYLLFTHGEYRLLSTALQTKNLSTSLFPEFSLKTGIEIFFLAAGWGLGYFGQPHIITKFMGINNVSQMNKAKWIGTSWQILSITGATLFGFLGIILFQSLSNPQLVVIEIVKSTLHPFFIGLVLCAILAATTNVMAAQILVVASSLSEDFYKRFFFKNASHKQVLWASRYCVVLVSILAFIIAIFQKSTILKLVLYAWSGLGSSFGPLLLLSLYFKNINKAGAYAGILTGGLVSAIWPYCNLLINLEIPPMIPGFFASLTAILLFSLAARKNGVKKI